MSDPPRPNPPSEEQPGSGSSLGPVSGADVFPRGEQASGLSDLRASDAERERTADTLRTAVTEGRLTVEDLEERLSSVYAARTRGELELLITDVSLRSIADGHMSTPTSSGAPPAMREGPGGTRFIVSIMSGHDRRGRWRIAPRCTVINVMGGSDIDLNDAEFSNPVTRINVWSIMGGGEVRAPHGVEVYVSGFALMGGNDVRLGDEAPPPGALQIRLRMLSIMGGCSVRRGRKQSRKERKRERELHEAERPLELEE
ncbi:MAG: DUF1707 domain-containing protein [Solirubrobacteraceae bacterium]